MLGIMKGTPVLTTLVAVALAVPVAMADLPPAFSDMAYEPAVKANAAKTDGLLVVKFTAEWCGPCKMMDRTTWSDDTVVGYLKRHGITVIAVDVDEHRDIAQANSIRAMPTMVVYRGGSEFDRSVGGMDSGALTGWLDDIRAGKTKSVALRERAGERVWPDGRVNVRERMEIARGLAGAREFDAAAAEFVWLWENMLEHEPAMIGVRGSFMASDMERLARESDAARAAFTALRDGLTVRLEAGETSRANLTDWLVLNIRVLGDDDVVGAWVDRIWERPTGPDTLRAMGHLVVDWLIEQGDWAKAGIAQPPAMQFIARTRGMRQVMLANDRGGEHEALMRELTDRQFIDQMAAFHAAALAAGREDDAWQAAEALLKEVETDEARSGLCRDALRAKVVRPRHAEIASAISGPEGDTWRERVAAALQTY